MARAGSIKYQVSNIIKAHNGIRQSKLESRNSSGLKGENGHNVSDKFHSYKSLDNARNDLINLGYFAKEEFGIKDMSKIDIEVIEKWIESKNITYHTASNYLSELNKVSEHFSFTRDDIKELRQELKEELSNNPKESRAYKGLENIQMPNEKSQIAFELQRDYGLRVKASTHINVEKQLIGNTLYYKEKGGKESSKELNKELADRIRTNAENGIYKISKFTYYKQLKKEIEKTGQKYNGTHGIRHTYAQRLLKEGKSKAEVSRELGHVREEITNIYIR